MNKPLLLFNLAVVLFLFVAESRSQSLYFPPLTGTAWETVTPASLGWCTDSIDALMGFLAANRTKAFIVLKDGRIVLEQYFGSFTSDSNWYWASAGKTLTAFMVGIAQHDGILSIDDSTSHYLGAGWTSCPLEKEGLIKVLNQLTMTTGLDDLVPDPECTLPGCLIYKADAGTRWAYHTAPYTLLDNVIECTSGKTINQYFLAKIRSHIGMNGIWVQSGYDTIYVSNARSMARWGLLILNRGVWDNDTLLADTMYFHNMTNTSQSLNLSYGYLWWLNGKASYMLPQSQFVFPGSWAPDAPSDMIGALGKNGQFINIAPSQRLIMVRMGEAPDSSYDVPTEFNNDIWRKLNKVIYNPLPIELTSFTASANRNSITLQWKTATEVNNYGFEVERREINTHHVSGIHWNKIGFILGNGTSNSPHEYFFTDTKLNSGHYSYRLKQIDNVGVYKYSQEIEVSIATPKVFALKQNYPNPFNPVTNISFSLPSRSFVTLKIFDVLGREVAGLISEELDAETLMYQWNAEGLPSGVYLYRLQAGLYVDTKKLILLR